MDTTHNHLWGALVLLAGAGFPPFTATPQEGFEWCHANLKPRLDVPRLVAYDIWMVWRASMQAQPSGGNLPLSRLGESASGGEGGTDVPCIHCRMLPCQCATTYDDEPSPTAEAVREVGDKILTKMADEAMVSIQRLRNMIR